MADLAQAYVAHTVPGRVRLRIPARRGDDAYFANVASQLREIGGAEGVKTNPRTGSVLINGLELDRLAETARNERLFALRRSPPPPESVIDAVGTSVDTLESGVKKVTRGEMDLASLAFVFFLGLGLVQLLRGNFAGPATTLFWYAAMLAQTASASKQFNSFLGNGGDQDG